jgi:hypothetical protein
MTPFSQKASITRRRLRLVAPVLFVALASTAFARKPPVPEVNLQTAQQAITNAERVEAATHAGVELGEARGKLAAARQAVTDKKMLLAAWLADEARVGAELAAAKAGAVKAKAVNEDIKRSTATLVDEMQRKTGGAQ